MFFYPQLGELGSAAMQLILVVGITAILPSFVNTRRNWHRTVLLGISAVLALRYIW